ncbi:hypothetical protein MIR68_010875 [Amoeboaphelidium protococcarum]|nr:hypothetical protein MIR68_010875 [Amoeboaphelidium protococcarum]
MSSKQLSMVSKWVKGSKGSSSSKSNASESSRYKEVFGLSLEEYIFMDKAKHNHYDVPIILIALCEHLSRKDVAKTEGILRISGGSQDVNNLKSKIVDAYLHSPVNILSLQKALQVSNNEFADPHVVATVLKHFLREIRGGVVAIEFQSKLFESCQQLISVQQPSKASTPKTSDLQRALTSVRSVLNAMPLQSKDCLRYIIIFMKRMSSFSVFSKMAIANLILLFSPNLFEQSKTAIASQFGGSNESLNDNLLANQSKLSTTGESSGAMMDFVKLSQVLNTLVLHFESLFGRANSDDEGDRVFEVDLTPQEINLFHGDNFSALISSSVNPAKSSNSKSVVSNNNSIKRVDDFNESQNDMQMQLDQKKSYNKADDVNKVQSQMMLSPQDESELTEKFQSVKFNKGFKKTMQKALLTQKSAVAGTEQRDDVLAKVGLNAISQSKSNLDLQDLLVQDGGKGKVKDLKDTGILSSVTKSRVKGPQRRRAPSIGAQNQAEERVVIESQSYLKRPSKNQGSTENTSSILTTKPAGKSVRFSQDKQEIRSTVAASDPLYESSDDADAIQSVEQDKWDEELQSRTDSSSRQVLQVKTQLNEKMKKLRELDSLIKQQSPMRDQRNVQATDSLNNSRYKQSSFQEDQRPQQQATVKTLRSPIQSAARPSEYDDILDNYSTQSFPRSSESKARQNSKSAEVFGGESGDRPRSATLSRRKQSQGGERNALFSPSTPGVGKEQMIKDEDFEEVIDLVEKLPSLKYSAHFTQRDLQLYQERLDIARPVLAKYQRYLRLIKDALQLVDQQLTSNEHDLRRQYYAEELGKFKALLYQYRSLKAFLSKQQRQQQLNYRDQLQYQVDELSSPLTPFQTIERKRNPLMQKYNDTLSLKEQAKVKRAVQVNVEDLKAEKHEVKKKIVELKQQLDEAQKNGEQNGAQKLKQLLMQHHERYLVIKNVLQQ